MLMTYASDDGSRREIIWNSRDGVTPFMVRHRDGTQMTHVHWQLDRYDPDYKPRLGDRVFVDLTMDRAREIARRNLFSWRETTDELLRAQLHDMLVEYGGEDGVIEHFATEYFRDGHAPDLREVVIG